MSDITVNFIDDAPIEVFFTIENDLSGLVGGAANGVVNEVPSGAINGSNATFTTAFAFNVTTLQVRLNGLNLRIVDDYQITNSTTFQMMVSPITGDKIDVDYLKA